MFEIGTTLRDARVRRDISLQQAEEDTKIRVKYIQAMENEDFDILPAGTYVKGFLRTYAEYLDLDYQLLIDEYNDRFGTGEHREHVIQPPKTAKTEAPRKRPANYIIVAILAVAIIVVLAYLGTGNRDTESAKEIPLPATVSTAATQTTPPVAAPAPVATTPTQQSSLQTVTILAKNDCWVELIRNNDKTPLIDAQTLEAGTEKSFTAAEIGTAAKLTLTVGNTNVVVTINGAEQPALEAAPADYEISATGLRKLSG